jgi:hypothetical protein
MEKQNIKITDNNNGKTSVDLIVMFNSGEHFEIVSNIRTINEMIEWFNSEDNSLFYFNDNGELYFVNKENIDYFKVVGEGKFSTNKIESNDAEKISILITNGKIRTCHTVNIKSNKHGDCCNCGLWLD